MCCVISSPKNICKTDTEYLKSCSIKIYIVFASIALLALPLLACWLFQITATSRSRRAEEKM